MNPTRTNIFSTVENKARLRATLDRSFIFKELHPSIKDQIVMAFKNHSFKAGDAIIRLATRSGSARAKPQAMIAPSECPTRLQTGISTASSRAPRCAA